MLKKVLFLSLILLPSATVCHAMYPDEHVVLPVNVVVMPDKKTLQQLFKDYKLKDFADKTSIVTMFANQSVNAAEIIKILNQAYSEYKKKYLFDYKILTPIEMKRQSFLLELLIEVLLINNQAVLVEFVWLCNVLRGIQHIQSKY